MPRPKLPADRPVGNLGDNKPSQMTPFQRERAVTEFGVSRPSRRALNRIVRDCSAAVAREQSPPLPLLFLLGLFGSELAQGIEVVPPIDGVVGFQAGSSAVFLESTFQVA